MIRAFQARDSGSNPGGSTARAQPFIRAARLARPVPVRVDVWSDLVCPWCHIGLHRLRRVAAESGVALDVQHHAYLLEPDRTESVPVREALGHRYGADRVDGMFAAARQAGHAEGVELDFDRAIAADTRPGHALVAQAPPAARDALVRSLMEAHFRDGLDLADADVLRRIAGKTGVATDVVDAVLAGAGAGDVDGDLAAARQMGVRGVPFFVFDGRYAFSGAHPDDAFREALRLAAQPADP
jgi:predicted DsbA family dithiol-disulfide isomerase